jgi:hypothetical protein
MLKRIVPHVRICVIIIFTIPGCLPPPRPYFLSPRNATNNSYKTIPLISDSIKTASYLSGMITEDGANDRLRDNVFALQTQYHRSHQFSLFQAFYGGGFSLGSYHIHSYPGDFGGINVDASYINQRAGSKFFGSCDLTGGVNVVMPFARGAEWRILGFETRINKEFGGYWQFRKGLPEHAANLIDKDSWNTTFSLLTDILGNIPNGEIGYSWHITSL